jgi:hypothetical protein
MNQKQILIIIGILALLCCCVAGLGLAGMWYAGESFGRAIEGANDPEAVARIADSIAEYDAPVGYEQMAFEIFSMKYVIMMPLADVNLPMIMLAQFPASMVGDQEEMRREMERSMARQTGQGSTDMQPVEQKTYTIRGQQVEATIMEGETETDGRSMTMRQMIVIFEGRSGVAALMFAGPKDGWDQAMIDSFIASIR